MQQKKITKREDSISSKLRLQTQHQLCVYFQSDRAS